MTLASHHRDQLVQGSGIDAALVSERGATTCTGYSELKSLGIVVRRDTETQGLLLPLHRVDGKPATLFLAKEDRTVPLMVYRPDTPQIAADGTTQKYLYPWTGGMRLDCHPRCQPLLDDPTVPLWVTEGIKKGDALVTHGACAVDVQGVDCWRGTNAKGGKTALPEWHDIALNGRDIRIVFDSDIMEKAAVEHALQAIAGYLTSKGAHVHAAYLPSAGGRKVGVDDYLLAHTVADLERLLEAPRTTRRRPAAKALEITTLKWSQVGLRPILFNVREILTQDPAWAGVLRYNAFAGVVELHQPPPPWALHEHWKPCALEEYHTSTITCWFQDVYDLYVPTSLVHEALVTLAHQNPYHPVQAYLTGLTWDRTPRLDTWLPIYCHTEDNPYTRAVGAKTLISAVARAMQPGCKVDTMTILVGAQGFMKSWVWRLLASEPWFTDHLSDLHTKDAAGDLRGKWLVEFADLDTFGRSEIETIKRFLSATQDHYRAPYARHASTIPRAVLFAGTTNKDTFLKDETGNRRFWPVKVEQACELAALVEARDQLWAEALHRYQAGEAWHLTGDVLRLAEEEQAARVEVDPWTTPITNYLAGNLLRKAEYQGQTVRVITTNDLLEFALGLETQHWHSGTSRRVAAILRLHDWTYARLTLKGEEDRGKVKAFIQGVPSVPDGPDADQARAASGTASSPHKTYSVPDGPDGPDTLRMYGEEDGHEEEARGSLLSKGKPSDLSGPSGTSGRTLAFSMECTVPDARHTGARIGSSGSGHRVPPLAFCPGCGKKTTWLIRGNRYVCYKCKTIVPHGDT